jgi:hypothetical protein
MVAGSAALVVAMAGCSTDSGPTTPDQDQALASTFDGMSRDANVGGDADAGAAFSGAAMAVRLGIRPTEIAVTVNGESRRYSAFVFVVGSTRALPIAAFRTLVAYRGENQKPTEVLYVAAGGDSVGLDHPMASGQRPDPAKFGVSSWKDLVAKQFYVATSGLAMIKQQSGAGTPCPNPSPRASVTCTAVKFGLRLAGDYYGLVNNQRGQLDRSKKVSLSTRAADVNGAVLIID